MFSWRNKKDISIFRMKKAPYLLLCFRTNFHLLSYAPGEKSIPVVRAPTLEQITKIQLIDFFTLFHTVLDIYFMIQYNLSGSNTDGLLTVDDSNSFFSPYKILPIAQTKQIFTDFFLFHHGIVWCVYTLELPHRGDSNEYTQHTIIV